MKYKKEIKINGRNISLSSPTYFIADIASNHDGSFKRAQHLIWLAKESGANAVKFQHFIADKIVSDFGFRNLKKKSGHQSKWKKSVYEVYKQYECSRKWTKALVQTTKKAGIDFLTTPYDYEALELLNKYLPAFKIGSGDITWINFIEKISRKGKPVILSTGAADIKDVVRAVDTILKYNPKIILLQCNTNYTGQKENFNYINLNVLKLYKKLYPKMLIGLSDHTPYHAAVLGAIALGARVIEKHFTDDNNRIGPDHLFSLNPKNWKEMIQRSRELEMAMGDGIKRIEKNEKETIIIQRRCLRVVRNMKIGDKINVKDLICLRPAPKESLEPYKIKNIIGKRLKCVKIANDALYEDDLIK